MAKASSKRMIVLTLSPEEAEYLLDLTQNYLVEPMPHEEDKEDFQNTTHRLNIFEAISEAIKEPS